MNEHGNELAGLKIATLAAGALAKVVTEIADFGGKPAHFEFDAGETSWRVNPGLPVFLG